MLDFNFLKGISPEQAKWIFLVLFILIALLVLRIPNDYIFQGLPKEQRTWYRNLKLWAIIVLTSIFITYYRF